MATEFTANAVNLSCCWIAASGVVVIVGLILLFQLYKTQFSIIIIISVSRHEWCQRPKTYNVLDLVLTATVLPVTSLLIWDCTDIFVLRLCLASVHQTPPTARKLVYIPVSQNIYWSDLQYNIYNIIFTFEIFATWTTAKLFIVWVFQLMTFHITCSTKSLWTFITNIWLHTFMTK